MRRVTGRKESFVVKLMYIIAFLVSALGSFYVTAQFSAWVKLKSDVLALLPIQLILIMLPMWLLSIVEGKVMWRLNQEDGFTSIYPVTTGICVGYLLNYI